MQRKVAKVIKALRKRGMTRAYIEIENKEFIYPPISSKRKVIRKGYLTGLALVILLLAGFFLFNTFFKPGLKETVYQNKKVNQRDTYGMSTLHHAVVSADLDQVKRLIRMGARVNIQDNFGWTPLHWAVFIKNSDICHYLVSENASITIQTKKKWFKYPAGKTPLEMARIVDDPAVLAILEAKQESRKDQGKDQAPGL